MMRLGGEGEAGLNIGPNTEAAKVTVPCQTRTTSTWRRSPPQKNKGGEGGGGKGKVVERNTAH